MSGAEWQQWQIICTVDRRNSDYAGTRTGIYIRWNPEYPCKCCTENPSWNIGKRRFFGDGSERWWNVTGADRRNPGKIWQKKEILPVKKRRFYPVGKFTDFGIDRDGTEAAPFQKGISYRKGKNTEIPFHVCWIRTEWTLWSRYALWRFFP